MADTTGAGNGNGILPIAISDTARLERSLFELEKAYGTTRDDTSALKFAMQSMQSETSKLASAMQSETTKLGLAISTLSDKLETRSRPNWPFVGTLIAGFITLMLAFPGGALYIVRGDIERTMGPLNAQMQVISAALTSQRGELDRMNTAVVSSAAADSQSRSDREQLNTRVGKNEERLSDALAILREMEARFSAALAEIESQFHSVSDVSNIHLAQQNRLNAIIWEKLNPGSRYPSDIFFSSSIFQQVPLSTQSSKNGHK